MKREVGLQSFEIIALMREIGQRKLSGPELLAI
jgi:hypothetical protein